MSKRVSKAVYEDDLLGAKRLVECKRQDILTPSMKYALDLRDSRQECATLRKRVEELEGGLEKYGQHWNCTFTNTLFGGVGTCDCGLDALIPTAIPRTKRAGIK